MIGFFISEIIEYFQEETISILSGLSINLSYELDFISFLSSLVDKLFLIHKLI